MGRNDAGRSAVTEVHLRELIVLNQDTGPEEPRTRQTLRAMDLQAGKKKQ